MNYWDKKQEMSEHAIAWTDYAKTHFADSIDNSVRNSHVYTSALPKPDSVCDTAEYQFVALDTVSAIFYANEYIPDHGRISALNFASYKEPGGRFLEGSSAQEESLCHASTLYPVLSSDAFKKYYDDNRMDLNYALYRDHAIYSPDIFFTVNDKNGKLHTGFSDIITCAAPNWRVCRKYHQEKAFDNQQALDLRTAFISDICADNDINTVILGAWGCGVFGQSVNDVARYFIKNITAPSLKCIIFAVPDRKSLDAFVTEWNAGQNRV